MELLSFFLDLLITALYFAIFGRVIMSWISPRGGDPLSTILHQITEPILGPIRNVLPKLGMFDFAPIIALIVLGIIQRVVARL